MLRLGLIGNQEEILQWTLLSRELSNVTIVPLEISTLGETSIFSFERFLDAAIISWDSSPISIQEELVKQAIPFAFQISNAYSTYQLENLITMVNEIQVPAYVLSCLHFSRVKEISGLYDKPKYIRILRQTNSFDPSFEMFKTIEGVLRLNSNQIIQQSNQSLFHEGKVHFLETRIKFSDASIVSICCAGNSVSNSIQFEWVNKAGVFNQFQLESPQQIVNLKEDLKAFLVSIEQRATDFHRIQEIITTKRVHESIIKTLV